MSDPDARSIPRTLLLLAVVGALGVGAGFVVGLRWPLEALEIRLGLRPGPAAETGWTARASTDLPRYEPLRAQVGDTLYVLGGFHSRETLASARVEALDLATGSWSRKGDMPVPVTHANPVRVRDTLWIAGGFEGDHPGPVTARVWRYAPSTDAWSEGPPLPAPRGGGALAARGDTLHYFGGFHPDRNTSSSDHWTLVIGDTAWSPAAPLPHPRGHLTTAVLDGRIWAVSGNEGHDWWPVDVPVVHVYDPAEDRWTEAPPPPFSVSHAEPGTVLYEDGFITVGGRALEDGRQNSDDVLYFSPERGRWIHLGRTPTGMRGGVAALRGDTLVAGLGASRGIAPSTSELWTQPLRDHWWTGQDLPVPLSGVAGGIIGETLFLVGAGSRHTLAYDIDSGRWRDERAVAARPSPGSHHAAEVVDGRLFLLGGLGHRAAGIVQHYDPDANRWHLGPPMPYPAGDAASAVIGGRIYVAGGLVDDTATARAAVLDPATMTWRPMAPMPRPTHGAASGTDGERFWVFGGQGAAEGEVATTGDRGLVQVYDPATDRWSVSDGTPGAPAPLPRARSGMGRAPYLDGAFWVVGGARADGPAGRGGGASARVDRYDPETGRWSPGPPLRTARHGIFPLLDAGRILVAGGRAGPDEASAALESLWPASPGGQR